jgi:hypothetical protein
MSNQKNENSISNENNKNQYKNLKEQEQGQETNNQITSQQNQYLDNIATSSSSSFNPSNTTKKVTNSINEYQQTNKAILEKSIDITNKSQQQQQQQQKETINTTQALSNNYIDLQQNLFTTFQSSFSKFIDDMFKSYCNNFIFPTTYSSLFAKSNQHILDNAIKNTRTIHFFTIEYTKTFKKSLEIAQKYYSNGIKNYFNYLRK